MKNTEEDEMSEAEQLIAKELARCTFLPASFNKRFARDMAFLAKNSPDRELTAKQRGCLLKLAQRYRRQLSVKIVMLAQDEVDADFRAALERQTNTRPESAN